MVKQSRGFMLGRKPMVTNERGSAFVQFSVLMGALFASGLGVYMTAHDAFSKSDAESKIAAAADTIVSATPMDLLQSVGGSVSFLGSVQVQARLNEIESRVNDSLSELSQPSSQGIQYTGTCLAAYSFPSSEGCTSVADPVAKTAACGGTGSSFLAACLNYLNTLRLNSTSCKAESNHVCAVLQYKDAEIAKQLLVAVRPKIAGVTAVSVGSTTFHVTTSTGSLPDDIEDPEDPIDGGDDTNNSDPGDGSPTDPIDHCTTPNCDPGDGGPSAGDPFDPGDLFDKKNHSLEDLGDSGDAGDFGGDDGGGDVIDGGDGLDGSVNSGESSSGLGNPLGGEKSTGGGLFLE